jgi:asparagine synthase (glutamine-hydrolysing)
MCGLCGVVYFDRSRVADESALAPMRDVLVHRGPDDAGSYRAPGIALGCRRLAILDLSSRGHLPMSTEDGRYWIAYNGEVYNHQELRSMLSSNGCTFHSTTDTEVVLRLYRREGPAMLRRLNGMFSIAVWDTQERRLFLARDRLGVKPLYYSLQPDALYFASEEKSLFMAGVPAEFDPSTWTELLLFRYVAGERTPFRGVTRLLPGHYLTWQDGKLEITRWWNLAERVEELRDRQAAPDPYEWFRTTFDDAVRLRRIADVPVGVLLSGGLDSSSVTASLATHHPSRVQTFTVRFDEPGFDEGPLARQLAEAYGADYRELHVDDEELLTWIERASWFNDEPLAHGNDVHLLAISQFAKPHVTVLLSGEGADETLGGYVRYRPLRFPWLLRAAQLAVPLVDRHLKLRGRWSKLARSCRLGSTERMVLYNACDVLPQDVGPTLDDHFVFRERILREAVAVYPGDPIRQAMYGDLHTFLCSVLDRNDRSTMGASIECRVPFLDYRLVEGVATMPTGVLTSMVESKPLLRRSVGHRLPEAIRSHQKWGFAVPWPAYFRRRPELRARIENLPKHELLRDAPIAGPDLQRLTSAFLGGQDEGAALVTQLVMILVWHESYFRTLQQTKTSSLAASALA